MYGAGGLHGTCVPPVRMSDDGLPANASGARIAWNASDTEPAVPTSNRRTPPIIGPGAKYSRGEPIAAPCTSAPVISASVLTHERCCGCKPDFFRPARILTNSTGLPRTADRATAVLRICPPPSPYDPSIVSTPLAASLILSSPLRGLLRIRNGIICPIPETVKETLGCWISPLHSRGSRRSRLPSSLLVEAREVNDDPLMLTLGNLLHLIEGLDPESKTSSFNLPQLRYHLHHKPDRSRCQMPHLHHAADGTMAIG